jgi:lipopolysaccharide transport system permease protein
VARVEQFDIFIEPPRRWVVVDFRGLWAYRELFASLATRDIKVRYKQTELGAAWAIIQPLVTMTIFTVVFGRFAGMQADTGGVPYPIFTYTALLPWTFFANTVTAAGNSMVKSANLITKVYFPRLLVPLSTVVTGILDFGIAFVVLLGMMVYFKVAFSVALLIVPLLALLTALCALGVGVWLSALNVEYRDFAYVIPFLVQVWMYATPVAYPYSLVPEQWRMLYSINPMVGVVEGFRWAVLGQTPFPSMELAMSLAVVSLTLGSGLVYFRYMERTFADVV